MTTISPANEILTTTVGSYPIPDWLASCPSEQTRIDATRVVFDIQRQAAIDLPTDGELYRFDINHPETNGMIEYFIRALWGIRAQLGRADWDAYYRMKGTSFRGRPAGVVTDEIGEGTLNLRADCEAAAKVAGTSFKFTLTSPYMLARLVLDKHYHNFETLTMAIARILANQMSGLPCDCIQVDEAMVVGNVGDSALAARAINAVLDRISCQRAVHMCFGNYGGQTIQTGHWSLLIDFLNSLHADHLVLELAHRPSEDLHALKDIDRRMKIGIGVIDVKVNYVESPDEIASRIETAEKVLGPGRVGWVHPDCGFWMLKRSVADRKIVALAQGRDRYVGKGLRTATQ